MSFVRRADGTVVRTGGHVGSRGSLSDVRHGGGEDFSNVSEADRAWEKKILLRASCSAVQQMFCDDMDPEYDDDLLDDYELNVVSRLFGVYIPNKSAPQFDERYFVPAGHSDFDLK